MTKYKKLTYVKTKSCCYFFNKEILKMTLKNIKFQSFLTLIFFKNKRDQKDLNWYNKINALYIL